MLEESDFVTKLVALPHGTDKTLFGDQAYALSAHVFRPWPRAQVRLDYKKREFNRQMSSCRYCHE
jgi:hypothetical protein